jgi:hypothetical protein
MSNEIKTERMTDTSTGFDARKLIGAIDIDGQSYVPTKIHVDLIMRHSKVCAERDALRAEVDTLIQNNHLDASRIREAIDNLEIPKGGLPKDRLGVWVLALNMVIEVIDKEMTDD